LGSCSPRGRCEMIAAEWSRSSCQLAGAPSSSSASFRRWSSSDPPRRAGIEIWLRRQASRSTSTAPADPLRKDSPRRPRGDGDERLRMFGYWALHMDPGLSSLPSEGGRSRPHENDDLADRDGPWKWLGMRCSVLRGRRGRRRSYVAYCWSRRARAAVRITREPRWLLVLGPRRVLRTASSPLQRDRSELFPTEIRPPRWASATTWAGLSAAAPGWGLLPALRASGPRSSCWGASCRRLLALLLPEPGAARVRP